MPRLLCSLSILALLSTPIALHAQDTPAPTIPPTAEEQSDDDGGADASQLGELDMGEEETDSDAPGTPYLKETVDDWAMECIRTEDGEEEPCQLFQSLSDENDNLVSNVRIFKLPEGQRAAGGALIAVPLETLLTAQLTIRIDEGQAKRYPFAVCDQLGCYARIGFTSEDIAALKRGANATVSITPFVAPDQPIDLQMSLKGFTAAFDKATVMPN